MKTYLDCIPCFFQQALLAARKATTDESKIREVLDAVAELMPSISLTASPPEIGREVYRVVRKITGVDDPFRETKAENIRTAMALYPQLKELVSGSHDPLLTALRIAIAGNIIDFGADPHFDLSRDLNAILKQDFAIFHYDQFMESIQKAKHILYLGDNAGETVFDRVLIEQLRDHHFTFVVRETPVINDCVLEDALDSGLGEVAEIISSGCDAPGTILSRCSQQFLKRLQASELVISKGQGNYESLSEVRDYPIFFLLKAKCSIIAKNIGVPLGSIILEYNQQSAF
ncbi:DUF89 family protein [bacterium]|nr:DUF89 family protein [bacterium]